MDGRKETKEMMRRLHIECVLLTMVMLLSVFSACNSFEYGFDESKANAPNPNLSVLAFKMDWGNTDVPTSTGKLPDTMTMLMSRKVHSLNYLWYLNSDTEFIINDTTVQASQIIGNGDYYLVAFNDYGNIYELTDYSRFEETGTLALKDLYATLPSVSADDVSSQGDIMDFNPYSGYVKHAEKPLYHFISKSLQFPNTLSKVKLSPTDLAREFTVRISVETEDMVSITRVAAVLSGVPSRVQLMTGFVSRNETAKVVFELQKKSSYGKTAFYEGKVKALGLFASQDQALITGPGILQVSLYASINEDGAVTERVFYAGINLKKEIDAARLMVQSEDKTGYWAIPQSDIKKIAVTPVLKVRKSQIESGEGDGYEVWFENEAEIKPDL